MRTLTLLVALAVLALPAVASGEDNPEVLKTGKCSNGATWKLKAKNDDGRIEVEFEVDQNLAGRRWTSRSAAVAPSSSAALVLRVRPAGRSRSHGASPTPPARTALR